MVTFLICLHTAYIHIILYGYHSYVYILRTYTCYCMVTLLICLDTAYIHMLLYVTLLIWLDTAYYIHMLLYCYFTNMFTYSVHTHVTVCYFTHMFYTAYNTCYCIVTLLICLNTAYIHMLLYGYFTNMFTYSVHTHVIVWLLY